MLRVACSGCPWLIPYSSASWTTAAVHNPKITSGSVILRSSSRVIPIDVPCRSIFSRSASNVSLSAHSGRASIKAFIILHTRCECDWPNIVALPVSVLISVKAEKAKWMINGGSARCSMRQSPSDGALTRGKVLPG